LVENEEESGEDLADPRVASIVPILQENMKDSKSINKLAADLLKGADAGLENAEIATGAFQSWLEARFKYQLVWLEKDDYTKALVRALWLAQVFAPTDFGGSRQRDVAQIWTDTARGFLGEIALSKFTTKNFGIETKIDTSRGKLEEYLPTDVAEVRPVGSAWKKARIKVSIKATKFNGRWLDVGTQFGHSDAFVLVKVGILRQHFPAFLKAISFLKDKLFPAARELGELEQKDADKLWDEIPVFEPIPAYVAGFLDKGKYDWSSPIQEMDARLVGRTERKKLVISHGVGLFSPDNVRGSPRGRELDPQGIYPIKIDPIIDSLTGAKFLTHSGALEHGQLAWKGLVERL
jgi:hypothetical protein